MLKRRQHGRQCFAVSALSNRKKKLCGHLKYHTKHVRRQQKCEDPVFKTDDDLSILLATDFQLCTAWSARGFFRDPSSYSPGVIAGAALTKRLRRYKIVGKESTPKIFSLEQVGLAISPKRSAVPPRERLTLRIWFQIKYWIL